MLLVALYLWLVGLIPESAAFPAEQLQAQATGSLDNWVAAESPIAQRLLLGNIGAVGFQDRGAASGIVVASPSDTNPNYCYTWTRDSALTFKLLVDTFIAGDSSLEPTIQEYIVAQAHLQTVSNPSGSLSTGGLAEPKFNLDETAFTGSWGRPQRDGPALRATALIAYGSYLVANAKASTATTILWPIISNDLSYVMENWNKTGFDLWEEVNGSSFFTTAVQHRALVEGASFATSIGKSCPGCTNQAPQILCFLQSYWNGQFIDSNINVNDGRTGKDSASVLASIHTFDQAATACDASTFQPCSDRALSNLKIYIDSFRSIYGVNSARGLGSAAAVGRYPEDVYYNGNPWYISTAAVAELLYDALYQWNKIGKLDVTSTSLAFFKDLIPSITIGSYSKNTDVYSSLTAAVKTYADGFMGVIQQYTPQNGSIAEQFDRSTGAQLSAYDLTWSYASFITAVNARNNVHPVGWGAANANSVPSQCTPTSYTGTYTTPTATIFPTGGSSTPPTTCPQNSISFSVTKTTIYGETIYLVGNQSSLGSWSTDASVKMNADQYTAGNPVWKVLVDFAPGVAFEYKYFKRATDGSVSWEGGGNRVAVVGRQCAGGAMREDRWQG